MELSRKGYDTHKLDKKIDRMIEFFEKYGEDYLQDNTKEKMLERLREKDYRFALDLLKSVDRKWIDTTKKVGKFYTFTDITRSFAPERSIKYRTSYLGSAMEPDFNVPVLRMECKVFDKKLVLKEPIDKFNRNGTFVDDDLFFSLD